MMINGIDISRWQGSLNFAAARAAGSDFCYMKASEGGSSQDPCLPIFHRDARLNHILAGAYHYFRPAVKPADQLANFSAAAGRLAWDLPPAIDCEAHDNLDPEAITACLQNLVRLFHQRYCRWPVIYTSAGYWNQHLLPWSGWSSLPLWVANWGVTRPLLPRDWEQAAVAWHLWQYSGKGNRQGPAYGAASRDIDLDHFYSTRADMVAWGLAENPPPGLPPLPTLEERVTRLETRLDALEQAFPSSPLSSGRGQGEGQAEEPVP